MPHSKLEKNNFFYYRESFNNAQDLAINDLKMLKSLSLLQVNILKLRSILPLGSIDLETTSFFFNFGGVLMNILTLFCSESEEENLVSRLILLVVSKSELRSLVSSARIHFDLAVA